MVQEKKRTYICVNIQREFKYGAKCKNLVNLGKGIQECFILFSQHFNIIWSYIKSKQKNRGEEQRARTKDKTIKDIILHSKKLLNIVKKNGNISVFKVIFLMAWWFSKCFFKLRILRE